MAALAIFLLLFPPPQRLQVNDLLDGATRTYSRLKDFTANFEQILTDPSNQRYVERGLLYLSRNGKKMRFDYQVPERKSYYSDGKTYTAYVPAVNQAVQKPVGKADDERLKIFQILVGDTEWREQYRTRVEPATAPHTPGNRLVQMFPSRQDLPEVLLEIDPRTFYIYRFELRYMEGERTEYRFSDMRTSSLDPSTFEFKPPPGTDVVLER